MKKNKYIIDKSMKNFRTFVACSLIVLATACSTQEEEQHNSDGRVPLQVTSSITRATNSSWENNDKIGLVLFSANTTTPIDGLTTYQYSTDGSSSFLPVNEYNTAYFPSGNAQVDVLSYYPFNTPLSTDLLVPISTANQNELSKIDFMVADLSKGHSSSNATVALNFKHKLSKVNIYVSKDESSQMTDLTDATVSIVGTATTASWSLTEANLKASNIADINVPALTTANGITATAIVLPTAAGSGVEVVITTKSGKVFRAPLSSTTELKPGTSNNLNITLYQTNVVLRVSFSDWNTIESSPEVIINGIRTGSELNSYRLTNGDELILSTLGMPVTTYTYYNAWSSNAPLRWDNFTEGNSPYIFHACIKPADLPSNGNEKDYLVGSKQVAFGEPIDLILTHALAKLSITLKAGVGYAIDAANPTTYENEAMIAKLTGRSILLEGLENVDVNVTDGSFKFSTNNKTASITGTTAFENGVSYIVAPQTLNEEKIIKLTLDNGIQYIVKLNTILIDGNVLTKLEAGKHYNLTVTLNNTGLSIGATLTDWTIINGGGTANPED